MHLIAGLVILAVLFVCIMAPNVIPTNIGGTPAATTKRNYTGTTTSTVAPVITQTDDNGMIAEFSLKNLDGANGITYSCVTIDQHGQSTTVGANLAAGAIVNLGHTPKFITSMAITVVDQVGGSHAAYEGFFAALHTGVAPAIS